jgi:iron complex outermembrane receptor protein
MKQITLGLALLGANLLYSQDQELDSIQLRGNLSEITLLERIDTTKVSEENIFIPIEGILKEKEGVHLISRGNFAQEPVLRVYRGEQVNVTLNGMRMFGACTDKMDPTTAYAETSNLESLAITQSGKTDVSGNAHGGALNLELKKASFSGTTTFNGLLGTNYATNTNGYGALGHLDIRSKNWGVYIQSSTRKHQNYYAGGNQEIQFSQYEKVNLTANLALKLSKREVLRIHYLYDKAMDVGYPSLTMDVGLAEAHVLGVHYKSFIHGNAIKAWETQLYYNSIYHEMDDTKRPNVPMHMDMPGWSKTLGAWVKLHGVETLDQNWNLMMEYYSNSRRAEMTMYPEDEIPMFMLTWPDILRHTFGLGFQQNWQLKPKWNLAYSLRADLNLSSVTTDLGQRHLEIFKYDVSSVFHTPVFSAKLNSSHTISSQWQFFAKLAFAERAPDLSEQFGFFLYNANDGYDYVGYPDIKKESAIQFEPGIKYAKNDLIIEGSAYFHHVKNYILGVTDSTLDAMTIGANGVRIYQNIPFANIAGFEIRASKKITKTVSLNANAQYSYAVMNSNESLPLIPPLQGMVEINWRKKGWFASVKGDWANRQDRVNENFGDQPTPGYVLLGAKVGKTWTINKTSITTEINGSNLLDNYYRNHLSWGQIPDMGRNIVLSALVNF